MPTPDAQQGAKGEALAAQWLEARGFRLITRNFRHGRAEIDLITQEGPTLVFVEVKWRKNAAFGPPEATVSEAQQERILTAADEYLHQHQHPGDIRFDVIALTGRPPALEVEHFRDAFG